MAEPTPPPSEKPLSLVETEYPSAPRLAVGALVIHAGRVLLVKRGKAPSKNFWAIPGGSVHLGESLQAAAEREVLEETSVAITAGEPIFTFDAIERDADNAVRYHYVIVDLAGTYLRGEPVPGDDARQARWIGPEELAELDMKPVTRNFLETFFLAGKR